MLFHRLCLLAPLATTTLAAPMLARRDLQTMVAAFDKIFTRIDAMVVALNELSGPEGAAKLRASNDAIVAALGDGASKIKASKPMVAPDLIYILGPVNVMESKVSEIISALDQQKAKVKSANVPVVELLTKDRVAADGLVSAIKANLPLSTVTSPIGGQVAATITNRLDAGIKAWGGTPPPGKLGTMVNNVGGALGSAMSALNGAAAAPPS